MPGHPDSNSVYWLKQPQWLFVGGSLIAAVVALIAEGPGSYVGLLLLSVCVVVISAWSLTGTPSLYWTVAIVCLALVALGWSVEEPEPALFQSILITAAIGWRIDRLSHSLLLLFVLASVPLVGSLGPNQAEWGWWNWSVGTLFTWSLGRVIRLLDQTLNELTEARTQLIDSAAHEERLRISRDVHDLVGHSLTAMLLNIRAAERALPADCAEAKQALGDAERVGITGIADIRAALVDIRDNAGVGSDNLEALASLPDGEAVLRLLNQQEHISVSTHGEIAALQGPLAVAVYRILQECITNISRYALDGTAKITLNVASNEIVLTASNARPESQVVPIVWSDKTLGLISMRERVASLGGTFNAGVEGNQWQVSCRIPHHG